VSIDPALLAEYDKLTAEELHLSEKLEALRERRSAIRQMMLGDNISITENIPPASTVAEHPKVLKRVRQLSSWERIRRQPPEALRSTVALVAKLGKATNKEVAEALGIPTSTASLRLSRAARDGFLNRVAQGIYEVDPVGRVLGPTKPRSAIKSEEADEA
jgi:hypothetical protein